MFITLYFLILWVVVRGEQGMADLTALKTRVDALAAVLPNIVADYATLKAVIEDLKTKIEDPTLQAQIDAATAKLEVTLTGLAVLDESVSAPVV